MTVKFPKSVITFNKNATVSKKYWNKHESD